MQFPNPFRLAWSWCVSAWANYRGFSTTTNAPEQAFRWSQCDPCPFNEDGQCQKCSCLVLAKIGLTMERCPDGKWGRIWRKKQICR